MKTSVVQYIVFLLGIYLFFTISHIPTITAAPTDKYYQYSNTKALISIKDLKNKLDKNENFILIDIRRSIEYMVGHIDGAINIWRPDYSADKTVYGFDGMAADKTKMEKLLSDIGATQDSEIIVYSSRGQSDANRFYWQLKLLGHENIRVLDGGIDAWSASGYSKTIRKANIEKKKYIAKSTNLELLASLEEVKSSLNDKSVILIDTRSIDEVTGKEQKQGAFRKGRIPKCIWLDYSVNLNEDGTFKTKNDLIEIYSKLGVTDDKCIIAYCQSGVRSAQTVFVLRELLGYKNVKNFDGSWIEWSFHKELPIETGKF